MELRKAIGNRVISELPTPVGGPTYLVAHACFECRKSWKLADKQAAICPQCRSELSRMGRGFKAPKKSDLEQWKKVEALWRAGFRFPSHESWRRIEPYPERFREVEAFIRENPDHPFRVTD